MPEVQKKENQFLSMITAAFLAAVIFSFQGCMTKLSPPEPQSQNMTQAPTSPLPTAQPNQQNVRTPLPPPTLGEPLPDDYEEAQLESVLPDSSPVFDPFTYGRAGSPYGPGKLFSPGAGAQQCGPMDLPMSSQFADPGDTQAVVMIAGNGVECAADIDHDKPGAALTFAFVGGPFTNPPWVIISNTGTVITITNGAVKIRFTYILSTTVTRITRVEYL